MRHMDKLVKIGGYAQDKLDTAGGYGLETFYTLGFGIVSTLQNKNLKLALDLKKKKKFSLNMKEKKYRTVIEKIITISC